MARWRIEIIGKHLQHIGTVEADSEREAIEAAIKELRIDPVLRSKVVATKVKE
jgi:hypothetical protein